MPCQINILKKKKNEDKELSPQSLDMVLCLEKYLPLILNRMILNWNSGCSKNKYCPGVYILSQYAGLSP